MQDFSYSIENKKFIIHNYNWAKSQANFFPGIAGKYGVPMWIYYVSRGQAICSAGINNKDHSLLEFLSFNKALDAVGRTCFRTFIKTKESFYEPFRKTDAKGIVQRMAISSEELELEDRNEDLCLSTQVLYFPLPNSNVPALVRKLTIKNEGSTSQKIELLDGLARIICYGMDRHCTQVAARHIEGMIEVAYEEGLPLFRLKQAHADVERITKIEGGNFYLSLAQGKTLLTENSYIVDPALVFGDSEIYERAWHFEKNNLSQIQQETQMRFNKTPSAFSAQEVELDAGDTFTLTSLIGFAKDNKTLKNFAADIVKPDFFQKKQELNQITIEGIKSNAFTISNVPKFDEYIKQMFLDNVIRGGMPVPFSTDQGKSAFYIYSRQNGDLERDYHEIIIEPTYFSQGTGHYRSVNQNRRLDCWFFPEVYDYNIFLFMNLLQTDGYNPLEVTTISYRITNPNKLKARLASFAPDKAFGKAIQEAVSGDFTPGQLLMFLEEQSISKEKWESILSLVLEASSENESGGIHEGFWVDHWHYNLDLIDNFLSIYPDDLEKLLLERNNYTFFDNPDLLADRNQKYMLVGEKKVRQYKAVFRDTKKKEIIAKRKDQPWKLRINHGKGQVYHINLAVKLLCLAANRLGALDPECRGVEMEADKPGWNDSMNGLPGLIGSSLCEAVELERLLLFLKDSFQKLNPKTLKLYTELYGFITKLTPLMAKRIQAGPKQNFAYWQASRSLKELYIKQCYYGISSKEKSLGYKEILAFIETGLSLVQEGNKAAFDTYGVPHTYFENQAVKWNKHKQGKKEALGSLLDYPLVQVQEFKQRPLARFLEGPMHMLRVHPELRDTIYAAVKKSSLYDTKLKMYKVCESLNKENFEIGRVKAWPSGWIENESVYTHMVYKYLLEILRSGLCKEFFEDMHTHFSCFLNPETYGRSIFENVSFIVSSAYADTNQHGRGFQARLSGVTSEVLHMWTLMVAGPHPFSLKEDGSLNLRLEPTIAEWFFTKAPQSSYYIDQEGKRCDVAIPENAFGFRLMGRCLVVYHNPSRKNTFDAGMQISSYLLTDTTGKTSEIVGQELEAAEACSVREGKISRLDVNITPS